MSTPKRRYRDGWFKVSRRIVDSSLWAEDPMVLKVWLFLLEQSQAGRSLRPGTVIISRAVLAGRCLITPEQLDAVIERLSSPDPESRTTRSEGRRVVVLPNGFRLVNHGEYHDADAAQQLSNLRKVAGRRGAIKSNAIQQAKRDEALTGQQTASKPPANEQQTRDKRLETEKRSTDAPEVAPAGRPAWTGDREKDATIAACYAGLREHEALTGEDPTRAMLRFSGAEGRSKPVARPELLSENALRLTLRDIQRAVSQAKADKAAADPHAARGW